MPETRNIGRQLYAEWFPQIVYKQHQTGPFPARIFIPPFDDPMNPNIAYGRLFRLREGWQEIQPTEAVREAALRFVRVHPLRAADAFQLAAAFVASEYRPSTLQLVSLNERLRAAAAREGFQVVAV